MANRFSASDRYRLSIAKDFGIPHDHKDLQTAKHLNFALAAVEKRHKGAILFYAIINPNYRGEAMLFFWAEGCFLVITWPLPHESDDAIDMLYARSVEAGKSDKESKDGIINWLANSHCAFVSLQHIETIDQEFWAQRKHKGVYKPSALTLRAQLIVKRANIEAKMVINNGSPPYKLPAEYPLPKCDVEDCHCARNDPTQSRLCIVQRDIPLA
jgi:hypothetical protein